MSSPDEIADRPIALDSSGSVTLRLTPLVLIVFLGFLTVGIPLPVLPEQVHHTLGFGTVVVGWVVGIQSLATVVTRRFAGTICDLRGPKRSVLLGLPVASLAGLAYLASAFFSARPGTSLAVLLLGRLLLGMAESLFLTGTMAWGMARVGPLHTGKVMAWQGIAIYAALGIGAPIGLAILRAGGFAAVAIVTVALPFAAILIALLLPATAPTPGKRLGFARVIGRILSPGLVLALATTPFVAIAAFIALDFSAQSWGGAGLAMLGFGAGFIVVRLFLAHLPDQLGGAPVAAVSLLIAAAGQISLWSAASPSLAIAGATLTGIGSSLVFPAMGVVAIRRVPPQNRGVAAGAYVAFFDIAIGVGGPLCGIIAGHYGYGSVFLASAVACLFAIALAVATRPASLGAATPPA